MNNFKRWTTLAGAVLLGLALAACGTTPVNTQRDLKNGYDAVAAVRIIAAGSLDVKKITAPEAVKVLDVTDGTRTVLDSFNSKLVPPLDTTIDDIARGRLVMAITRAGSS